MHTDFQAIWIDNDSIKAKKSADAMENIVRGLDGKLNRHQATSAIGILNREGEQDVDEDLWVLLQLCEQFRLATDGFFDIAALSGSRLRPAYILDSRRRRARLQKGIMLDFGGIAKGYALDKCANLLRDEFCITQALLNFGGSSVLGIGSNPNGPFWKVGTESGEEFSLKDSALSISGRSRNGREHISSHGKLVNRDMDVAVTGGSAMICEVLSTAIYACPEKARDELISGFDGYKYRKIQR